jgi:hypothetical protein
MKISSHFKKLDFKVDLKKMGFSGYKTQKKVEHTIDASEYDKVFLSTIFTCNKGFIKINNCSQIYRGGTGFDYKIALPENIEHNFPDYSLYPKNKYSMGFLTRGCIRNCDFCVVPKKEGMLKHHANLEEFYHPGLPKVMLLDNNFLATRNCIELMNLLKETNKAITFKQGLDFRLLTKEKAEKLSELKYDGEYIFAFDNYKDKKIILKNMEIWKLFVNHWRTKFFVLVSAGQSKTELKNPNPSKVFFYESVPQIEVLQKCSFFIHHGGMNSTIEAISFQVPMLIIPQTLEQLLVGYRVQEIKKGYVIPTKNPSQNFLDKTIFGLLKKLI